MKKLTSFLAAILIAITVYGQIPIKLVKDRISNPDILKNWKVGETKEVNGVAILRLDGENGYDDLTNLFFTPKDKIMKTIDEKAMAESLTASEKSIIVEDYKSSAPGGQISLFYCRASERLAEPTLFTIRIKDESDHTVYNCTLAKEPPYYYKWGIWYFHKTVNIPTYLGHNFTVEVIDQGTKHHYKFAVSGNTSETDDLKLLTIN